MAGWGSGRSLISVLISVPQNFTGLVALLEGLSLQDTERAWDLSLLVRDDENERLARRTFPVPLTVHSFPADEMAPPWDRNLLAGLSSGELLVFITDFGAHIEQGWLRAVAETFDEEGVGASCTQSSQGDVGLIGLRRELWERHPLQVTGAEPDSQLAAALCAAGVSVAGCEEALLPPTRSRLLDGGGSLRVLQVIHGFPPESKAGSELYTFELSRALERRGHYVSVFTRTDPDRLGDQPEREDFSVRSDDVSGMRVWRVAHRLRHERMSRSYNEPRVLDAFRKVLLEERPDVVHVQHLLHLTVGIVNLCQSLGLPVLVHGHDFWPVCPRVQWLRPDGRRCENNMGAGCYLCVRELAVSQVDRLERVDGHRLDDLEGEDRWLGLGDIRRRPDELSEAYKAAGLVVCPSQYLRRSLIDNLGLDEAQVLYSTYGHEFNDSPVAPADGEREDGVCFGCVGTLQPHKGIHIAVEAFCRMDHANASLSVFGHFEPKSDPYHAHLAELSAGNPNIRFEGAFSADRCEGVYRGIDALLVPSIWAENSPLVLMEAAHYGVPSLVGEEGGMAECIIDGVEGLHFKVGDIGDLGQKMQQLVDHPELLGELTPVANRVKPMDVSAAEMEFLYRGLICLESEGEGSRVIAIEPRSTSAREGATVEEGDDILLGPMPATGAVEYELGPINARRCTIELRVPSLAGESHIVFGGRVLLNGEPVGEISPFAGSTCLEERVIRIPIDLEEGAGRLRLENRCNSTGDVYALRVGGMALVPGEPGGPLGGLSGDRRGADAVRVAGMVERQGVDMISLGPEAASIEFDLQGLGAGEVEFTIWVPELEAEAGMRLAGRVIIDGVPVGWLPPVVSSGRDRTHVYRLKISLREAPRVLRIDNRKSLVRRGHLRVQRVRWAQVSESDPGAGQGLIRRLFSLPRATIDSS